jgi:transmembrane sensor
MCSRSEQPPHQMTRNVSSDLETEGSDERRRLAGKEASVFMVLLAEHPDDEELKARITLWCAQNAINQDVWARTERTYRMMGGIPARHADSWVPRVGDRIAQDGVPPASRTVPLPGRAGRGRRVAAFAAIGLAAAIALVAAPPMLLQLRADAVTSTGELRTLVLDDGSKVVLAPRSAVSLSYTDARRGVRLLQGSAYFEVLPDPARPFRVVAGEVETTVLGTEFEVALEAEGTSVSVREGRVRVDDKAAWPPLSAQLTAGDWLRVSARGAVDWQGRAPGDVASWTTGLFVVRNQPISEIVDRLRGYYGGTIILQDDAFARRLVSGAYDLRDPQATLRNLASAHNAVVRQISPWVLLVTSR